MLAETRLIEDFLLGIQGYVRGRYAARDQISVSTKSNASDLLTEVDVSVQQRAIAHIAEAFPNDAFVGEEEGLACTPTDPNARCWVMDPIDGTYNFVRGLLPAFGVSLAFVEHGVPQAGGVLFPVTGDLFLAERGAGAQRNGQPLRVSTVHTMEQCSIGVDFAGGQDRLRLMRQANAIIRDAGQIRCHGCAVIGICQVASGDADAYLHLSLTPWDYAASQIIVEEAGGRASRPDGSPLHLFDHNDGVLFTNGAIHETILRALTIS